MKRGRLYALSVASIILSLVLWNSAAGALAINTGTDRKDSSAVSEQETTKKLQQFEAIAEELYTHMQAGNTQEALAEMQRLIDSLEGLSFKGLTSIEGIHALAESIMDTRETLARAEIDQKAWIQTSARLRLAVNSLTHKDQALWMQYYKVMGDNLQQMESARAEGNRAGLRTAFQSLQEHYAIVRPAAVIRRDPSVINQFDSWLSYAERLSNDKVWDEAAIESATSQGEGVLKELFGRRKDEPVFLPVTGYGNPWYWSTLIGGWIILALTYTAFRKYRADQAVSTVKKHGDGPGRYRF